MIEAVEQSGTSGTPRRNNAARLFGYDMFISFALGAPPRGTQSYASDLARRLRERDITVFFSQEETAPGEQLDDALLKALQRSHSMVVIANRATLEQPRWVRKEVEAFRCRHADRSIILINVDDALQDTALARQTREWLEFGSKIWLDESGDAVANGIASDELVERLALAPAGRRSNTKWRWLMRGTAAALAVLSVAAAGFAIYAFEQADEAQTQAAIAESNAEEAQLQRKVAEDNATEAQKQKKAAEDNAVDARTQEATAEANADDATRQRNTAVQNERESSARELAAYARGSLDGHPENSIRLGIRAVNATFRFGQPVVAVAEDILHQAILSSQVRMTLRGHSGTVDGVAYSPDGQRLATVSGDSTVKVWDARSGLGSVLSLVEK